MKVVMRLAVGILVLFPPASASQVAETFKQLEHSKLYQNYGNKTQKLTEGHGDKAILGEGHVPLYSTLPRRLEVFRKMACRSDAVILGKVVRQDSMLTPDETFVFTDATVSVLEVLKDYPGSHLYPGEKITVTRPGGSLQWNSRKLTAKLAEFRDFSTGGEYLLFLKFLPTTLDYQSFGNQSFELRDGMILNLTSELLWHGQPSGGQDAIPALSDARKAVLGACK